MAAEEKRRVADRGWLARSWQFIDDRQIDAHVLTVFIAYGTAKVTAWAFAFAYANPDAALTIGAVMGPWSLLQAAAIKFHFDARK